MSHSKNQKDTNQDVESKPSSVHGGPPTRRIREGKTRGGVNDAPTTPRPNVRPGPQKPTGSPDNSQESDGDE